MATQLSADQLATTIDAVRAELGQAPEAPIATFTVDSALVDGYRTEVRIREFGLSVDEPPTIGGSDTGPTPVELVLAALGTCQEIVYATYARILGIPLNGVTIRTEGRLDLRGFFGVAEVPAGFQDVTFAVDIDSPAAPEEIAKLVSEVNAHCPVLDILRQPVAVAGSYQQNGKPLTAVVA
ncbi:MAG: OsmC family protein [Thermomicrobiales bacterium]